MAALPGISDQTLGMGGSDSFPAHLFWFYLPYGLLTFLIASILSRWTSWWLLPISYSPMTLYHMYVVEGAYWVHSLAGFIAILGAACAASLWTRQARKRKEAYCSAG